MLPQPELWAYHPDVTSHPCYEWRSMARVCVRVRCHRSREPHTLRVLGNPVTTATRLLPDTWTAIPQRPQPSITCVSLLCCAGYDQGHPLQARVQLQQRGGGNQVTLQRLRHRLHQPVANLECEWGPACFCVCASCARSALCACAKQGCRALQRATPLRPSLSLSLRAPVDHMLQAPCASRVMATRHGGGTFSPDQACL